MKFKVVMALSQGYGAPVITSTVVSSHSTLERAVAAARKNDRRAVVWGEHTIFVVAARGTGAGDTPDSYGRLLGRYGLAPRRGEPTLEECIHAAHAAYNDAREIEEDKRG